jgi:transposase InsO family protein
MEVDMPWKERNRVDQRVEFLGRAVKGHESISELCREFGISRTSAYKRIKRYVESGSIMEAALDRSRRPHNSPLKTPESIEKRVEEIRLGEGWGTRIIEKLLEDEAIDLAPATISRILKRRGLIDPKPCHRPALKRFQRETPNELWQMDFKGHYKISDGRCHPLTILDDHSRFLLGLYALEYERAELVKSRLINTFERFGLPEAILMDHGSLWWSTTNSWGLTWLSVWLLKQDIDLLFCAIRHPQTQGKVERFHRTLESSLSHKGRPSSLVGFQRFFDTFRETYNKIRPHEALGMQVPESHYNPSHRSYNPHPKEYEYPSGSLVKRLNSQGMVEYEGIRYFVCEALAGERVELKRVEDLLLVRYRKGYVREINIKNCKSRPPKLKNKQNQV